MDSIDEDQEKKPPRSKKQPPAIGQQRIAPQIYIGPNLRGRLSQYTVFRDRLPIHVETLLEQQPHIRELIVPVTELSQAQLRAATPGTIEYRAAQILKGGK